MPFSWRDTLRPSSFRGVPFEVRSRKGETGRRGPDHEFPGRDEGFPEDTGRKLRRFNVEAFLLASRLGAAYLPAKALLLEALEQEGPGDYIDPWGGRWRVQVRSVSWTESVELGGYVSFSIAFVEYGEQALHTVQADTAHAVLLAGAAARVAVVTAFDAAFDPRGNGDVASRAQALAEGALDLIGAALDLAAPASRRNGEVAALARRAAALRSNPWTGAGFGLAFAAMAAAALVLHAKGWHRYRAARALARYGRDLPPIVPSTAMRARAAANRAAMIALVRALAAIEAAEAAAAIPFTVYDDAVMVRGEVAAALDAAMMSASDAVYAALDALRAAAIRDITARGADLSRLSEVAGEADQPALALAHRLYGDAGRETDVLARNPAIRHPGFIPGGLTLKVPAND